MPLRHFLICLDFDECQTLGLLIFPHQEHVWFIGCVFNTPCPTCAFSMLWSCIAHRHLLHRPLLSLSYTSLYLVSLSQYVIFTLCFVAFYFVFFLSFIFSFILHPSCIFILVHTFISCPFFFLDPCLFVSKRGRVFSKVVYRRVFSFLNDSCAHSQGEKFFFLCTFVGGEIFHRGDAYLPRERRHCVNKKTLFCMFFFMFVFLIALWCFDLCLVSMLCCCHCIVFVYWTCIHPYAIVLY